MNKKKTIHTANNHRLIILKDLEKAGKTGKTALAFREEHNIADVPAAVCDINRKNKRIVSLHPNTCTVIDKDGMPRKTVKYWLSEYAPNKQGADS